MKYEEILKTLKAEADPKIVEGMGRFGIRPRKAFGVSLPVLRKLAKAAGRNHLLAKELWAAGYRETRILAAMVDEPEKSPRRRWMLGPGPSTTGKSATSAA